MPDKATKFHVADASVWEEKFPDANVTFVGDLKPKHDCGMDGHIWGEWNIVAESTCTEEGKEERVCTICGETDTQGIPALGHDMSEWKTVVEPTCTEEGKMESVCSRCGKTDTQSIPALGHDWNADGVCSRCGQAMEQPDAIESITSSDASDGAWYTLNGQKLDGEPTAPGVYVKDGKKVVVK